MCKGFFSSLNRADRLPGQPSLLLSGYGTQIIQCVTNALFQGEACVWNWLLTPESCRG